MATYRLTRPLVAFASPERQAFTIPAGTLIEKENLIAAIGLTGINWAGKSVSVAIQDFIERSELIGEIGENG